MLNDYKIISAPNPDRPRPLRHGHITVALAALTVITSVLVLIASIAGSTPPKAQTAVSTSTLADYYWYDIQSRDIQAYCLASNYPAESYFGGEPDPIHLARAEGMCLTADAYYANANFALCSHWLILATQEVMPGNVARKSTPLLRTPRQTCHDQEGLGTTDINKPITSTSS